MNSGPPFLSAVGSHHRLLGRGEQLELLAERRHQGLVLLGLGDQLGSKIAHVDDR